MLLPDSRAVLLDALRPPVGHQLDGAVATTFTLDLTAAVIPPLAFSAFRAASGLADPVTVLEAVRGAAAKIDIFCQGGNIAVPQQAPDLLAFVEPMVHAVRRPPGHLFHPKIWFIRYVDDEGGEQYRLLILTRNLTNDRAWDIVVRLDSRGISSRRLPDNRDLHDFLETLPSRAIDPLTVGRRRRVEGLAHAAQYVEWDLPEGADGLGFHFLDGRKRLDLTGRRHLVVSPFITDEGLDLIAPRSQRISVVSRPEELERLEPDQLRRVESFIVDAMAGIVPDDEIGKPVEDPAVRPRSGPGLLSGLHAKMIVVEPEGRAHRARVLIGSANATGPALTGNVEFMIEIQGPRRILGVDTFLGDDGSLRKLVEPYEATGGLPHEGDDNERWELEDQLRAIAEVRHTLTVEHSNVVTASGSTEHALRLTTDRRYPTRDAWSATVELLTAPGAARYVTAGEPVGAEFSRVLTADISPFISVHLTSPSGLTGSTVVVAHLVGEPADRLDLVLARQIDTPEKFLRFLYLVLSLSQHDQLPPIESQGGGGWLGGRAGGLGVLEVVLRALAERPSALDDLGRLVRRLAATDEGSKLLPAGFETLWDEVERARRQLTRSDA